MDVYGKAPTTPTGEYFWASIWGWRPLADLITELAPEVVGRITYLHSNDGDGLDGPGSIELADQLDAALSDGRVKSAIVEWDALLAALPRLSCEWCQGTGTRSDAVGCEMGMVERKWCNGCDGSGNVADSRTRYLLAVEDVEDFAVFCRESGGFDIC